MKAFVIRFLLAFCSLTVSVYCGDSSNLRLRDIDATGQEILFRGKPISARHRDLIDVERKCKAQLLERDHRDTTNLAVGKLVVFYDDGREKELHLHELSQEQNMMVFDSGNHRKGIIEALKNIQSISCQFSMIDADSIISRTAHNFPAIPESKKFMEERRNDMLKAIESKRVVEDARKECNEKHAKLLGAIEKGSLVLDDKGKIEHKLEVAEYLCCAKKFTTCMKAYYRDGIGSLVNNVWHSEPRILALLTETLKPRSLLDSTRNPSVITLHLHSTNNVCDCCRLQLVGATYNWLYEAAICALGNITLTPKFHIIVTWFDEFDKKSTKNSVSTAEIKDVDFAAFDLAHPNPDTFSTPGGGFFLTLVKLDKAKFPTPAIAVGAAAAADTA